VYQISFWVKVIVLGLILRFFLLWQSNSAWYDFFGFIGTGMWGILALFWIPVWLNIMRIWRRQFMLLPKNLDQDSTKELSKQIKMWWLILAAICIFTLNYIGFSNILDEHGHWKSVYQRLYPSCEAVSQDEKKWYSADCR
jgi:hypothetical protein